MKKMYTIRKGELVGVLLSFLLISCESSVTSPEDNSEQLFLSFDNSGIFSSKPQSEQLSFIPVMLPSHPIHIINDIYINI